MSNAAVIALALVCGWVAAWPARRVLEPIGWAILGLPIGLFGWVLVALFSTVMQLPWTYGLAAAGLTTFAASAFLYFKWAAAQHLDVRVGDRSPWSAIDRFAAGSMLLALASAVLWYARDGRSIFGFDSFNFYEPYGSYLVLTGDVSVAMYSSRSVLIPAVHAAGRLLGGSWHHVLYPIASLTCMVFVAWGTYRLSRHLAIGRFAVLAGGGAVAVMSIAPPVFVHSLYVHSHVVSAMYLLVATIALLLAFERHGEQGEVQSVAARRVWLAVAGIATAGLVLARPDGMAYAFVPIAILLALEASARVPGGPAWFFGAALAPTAPFLAAIVAREGVWSLGSKLEGNVAVGITALMFAVSAASIAMPRFVPRLSHRTAFGLAVTLAAFAVAALLFLIPEKAARAAAMMAENVVREGGWGPLWVYLAVVSAVGLTCVPWRTYPWVPVLAVTIGLFFATAFLVHGATHPGRLGWGDSFNRVSYHAMPLTFMLVGAVAAAMLNEVVEALLVRRSARMDA